MAAIGKKLRELREGSTYSSHMAAYGLAALVSAGPWMISIAALMLLTWLLHQIVKDANDIRLFTASIAHVYAFALVITGPLQILLSRYTADQISNDRLEKVFPSFRGGLMLASVLSALVGGIFFIGCVPAPWQFQVGAAVMLVYVSAISAHCGSMGGSCLASLWATVRRSQRLGG
jgi:polysaccharide biosynthesis protein PelG